MNHRPHLLAIRLAPKRTHVVVPLLVMVALYALSSLPGTPLPRDPRVYSLFSWLSPAMQNVLHIPAYAALGWAWRWSLSAWSRRGTMPAVGAWMIALGYGALDEWHQSFVPGRYASLEDVLLDCAGAWVGVWLAGRMIGAHVK